MLCAFEIFCIIYFQVTKQEASGSLTVISYLIPALFSLIIMIPLLMTLYKLRYYHKEYMMKINVKKVVVHLCVTILIFTYYILRFLFMHDWMDLILTEPARPENL